MKQYFISKIDEKGHVDAPTRLKIAALLARFVGKSIRIEVSLYRKRRSDAQNSYYYGVIIPTVTRALRDWGNDVDEDDTHQYLKDHVGKLGKLIMEPSGESKKLIPSSADLKVDEFSEWMERIWAWAASKGITIQSPTEAK